MGSGSGDINLRLQRLAQQTKDALGASASVELVATSDTTYRVWEEFHKKYPNLPVPSRDGSTTTSREFSYLPDEGQIDRNFAAAHAASVQSTAQDETGDVEEETDSGTVEETENSETAESPEESTETPEDEVAENTEETTATGKYAGENKPASTANWADLNGKNFEVIDEPDENGDIPTRPIHGNITIEGEAKNGENPAKFTITDSDNGGVYTFELDTSITDKVVYRCTSGPGGKTYSKGNDYELRTIGGNPILVQMKTSEGHGIGVARVNADVQPPVEEEENPVDGEGEDMTPEERQAKIAEEAAAIMKADVEPADEAETAQKANLAEEQALFSLANTNLATAAYSEPKLEVTSDEENRTESVTLPNGQKITIERGEDGKIIIITIKANEAGHSVTYDAEGAIGYSRLGTISSKFYDWNKILELAKRIFGE